MKLPESSVIGKTDMDFFPKSYAEAFRSNDLMVIEKGVSIEFEEKAPHDDGDHIYRTVKFPLYDANRQIYAICGLSTDVTDRKKEEAAAALLASIITTSEDAIISENLEGIVTSWNSGAEHLFGYSSEEMVGQHIRRIIPPERIGEETELLKQLKNRKAIRGFETFSVTKDGRTLNISLTMSPMYNAAGQMIGVSRVKRDISQQKEVQAQLLKYTWELERSNQELDDFAYIASHDLKEPLRGLFNHASFLLEDYAEKLDDDAKHRLNRLSTLAQRMEYLINDLLYFSRLGRTQLAIRDSDPNAMVEEIQQMLDGVLQEYNAYITVPKPMPNLVCDKPRITEVFRNLITNAIKYNDKPKREIEVGMLPEMQTKIGTQKNVFYVKDNGIGIAKEFHEEIFRIFKRLNKPTNDKEGSTGVGLTFVKKIIERHNGHIWLESEPGVGSTFYFTVGKKTHE
jgi:PAS domain S-box-containing protein